ncbi:FGGY family carbohydrate kinase [Aeromicrobium sp. UC242_57]|uniref:FGGY family carbohydrate kinase n=1 Tax=Aeromicrobium sp. UC242_57 TaxID=3374624 RepID=UPI0037A26DA0
MPLPATSSHSSRRPHPPGTAVDPRAWLTAFDQATADLLPRASAVAVGGQQHGMVALDPAGDPVFDALLWNDTRSSAEARDLIDELGGAQACAETVGSVLVASFTSTKLRWLRDHRPEAARRVHEVLLPHDYISRHLTGETFTDRGDASGTGYFSTAADTWRPDLAEAAIGHPVNLPRIVGPAEVAAHAPTGAVVAAGTGDNMAAALALDVQPGDVVVSIGTSGVASSISATRVADGTGSVTGFADATGRFLPHGHDHERRTHPRPAVPPARRRPRRARSPRARRTVRRKRPHVAAVLRRRAHPQPPRRHRHLGWPHLVHDT